MTSYKMRRQFEKLALPHLDAAHSFAVSLTRDRSEAEDLVQDSYLAALRNFRRYRIGSNFRAWLFAILRNRFLDVRRKAARCEAALRKVEREPAPSGGEPQEAREVSAALDTLPEIYRTVLVLAYRLEMKTDEIARVVGCPRGTVLSRLSRGRERLRRLWVPGRSTERLARRASSVPLRGNGAVTGALPPIETSI